MHGRENRKKGGEGGGGGEQNREGWRSQLSARGLQDEERAGSDTEKGGGRVPQAALHFGRLKRRAKDKGSKGTAQKNGQT